MTWLADGGMRIGELRGLHLVDLHLRENAACGECHAPHLHVCHRPGNPNGVGAKTKHPWRIEHGTVTGGLIKRVSPAMVHAYFEYVTSEYPRRAGHGMLLVQLHGAGAGQPWHRPWLTAPQVIGKIEIQGDPVGSVTMAAGTTTLTVNNAAATANSLIFLTPLNNPQAFLWINTRYAGNFTINASQALLTHATIMFLSIN